MKKAFLPNSTVRTRKRLGKALFFVILVVIIFLFGFWRPVTFSPAVYTIISPVVHLGDWIEESFSRLIVYFDSKLRLEQENEFLSQRLAKIESENIVFQSLYPEVGLCKEYLTQKNRQKGILVGILLAPPLTPYDSLVLEVGAEDGIAIGDIIKTENEIVIGRITEIFKSFSRAILFSSPGEKTAVRIGVDEVQVEAVGVGNGLFQLLMPREFEINIGDKVLFPGSIPKVIGEVGSVEFREEDFLQLISFRLPLNISALRFVIVERGNIKIQEDGI